MDTNERMLEMQTIFREIDRKREEERQKIIDELKLTRNEKAEIFKLKKENVERKILILKNEVEKFKKQKKEKRNIFLKVYEKCLKLILKKMKNMLYVLNLKKEKNK